MLTTKNNTSTQPSTVSREQILKFISENQQLEGFSGEITQAVREHVPDLQDLKMAAERFASQNSATNGKPTR